jgi:transposase InsO family protein
MPFMSVLDLKTDSDNLRSKGIAISMDGKGRWMDNVFIERLWKSVKYEDITALLIVNRDRGRGKE